MPSEYGVTGRHLYAVITDEWIPALFSSREDHAHFGRALDGREAFFFHTSRACFLVSRRRTRHGGRWWAQGRFRHPALTAWKPHQEPPCAHRSPSYEAQAPHRHHRRHHVGVVGVVERRAGVNKVQQRFIKESLRHSGSRQIVQHSSKRFKRSARPARRSPRSAPRSSGSSTGAWMTSGRGTGTRRSHHGWPPAPR
jgi:hypothetical protein